MRFNRFVLKEEFRTEVLGLNEKLSDILSQNHGQKKILHQFRLIFFNISSGHHTLVNS